MVSLRGKCINVLIFFQMKNARYGRLKKKV